MKKLLSAAIFFMLASIVPTPAMADADADSPQGGTAVRDEKRQDQSLETGKATESEHKSDWRINLWPAKPPPADNVRSLHEMKDENKHIPPDRF